MNISYLIRGGVISIFLLPHIIFYIIDASKNEGALKLDIERWLKKKNKNFSYLSGLVYLLAAYPEFRSLFYHRIGKFKSFFCRYLPGRSNLYISTDSSRIGGGFYIGHGWGTVINAERIGKNCGVAQNVTIGSRNLERPILEDEVMVWGHSVIIGGVVVGKKSQVGAGSIVVKDIPHDSVCVPPKTRLVQCRGIRVDSIL